jgi:hypothetical protein
MYHCPIFCDFDTIPARIIIVPGPKVNGIVASLARG